MRFARLSKMVFVGAALLVCAQVALATSVYLDKDALGKGDKGEAFRPSGADFVMTAKWGLNADGVTYKYDKGELLNPYGTPGLVYVDDDGTGVWADSYKYVEDKKHPGEGEWVLDPGSNGISGGGPHGQEQLIFTFDSAVFLNSLIVGLVDFEFGKGIGDKDDPIFFLLLNDSSFVGVNETLLKPAFIDTGDKTGYVDLSQLTVPGLAGNPLIDVLTIHNAKDHYEVNSLAYEIAPPVPIDPVDPVVPEPVTLFATFAGMCAIAGYLRRRNAVAD